MYTDLYLDPNLGIRVTHEVSETVRRIVVGGGGRDNTLVKFEKDGHTYRTLYVQEIPCLSKVLLPLSVHVITEILILLPVRKGEIVSRRDVTLNVWRPLGIGTKDVGGILGYNCGDWDRRTE